MLLLIIFLSASSCFSAEQKNKEQKSKSEYMGVKKLNDDLYVGKVADKFYVAMERIYEDNIDMWLKYARSEYVADTRKPLKYVPSPDGSGNFEEVLKDYKEGKIHSNNELWIAYASDIPVTRIAESSDFTDKGATEYSNPHIEMFFTVITSQDALITSHMGISRSWEAAKDLQLEKPTRIKHPDQSIHLHSFAAKVMKMHDARKVYMLTAPTVAMREILIKKMPPDSVFVGDNLYKERLEEIEKNRTSLISEAYKLRLYAKAVPKTEQEKEEIVKKEADDYYKNWNIKEKIALLKTNPPRIIRRKDGEIWKFIIQNPKGEPLVSFDKDTEDYQWLYTFVYRDTWLLPYVLVDLEKLANVGKLATE